MLGYTMNCNLATWPCKR